MSQSAPCLDELAAQREQLRTAIVCTPTIRCAGLEGILDNSASVYGKLEFLQRTGTFKARGALATVRSLSQDQLSAGVTAVSAGNHAIATAFAAQAAGTSAKVVVTASANAVRVAASRKYGAEVVVAADVHSAFAIAEQIQRDEGRYFVHPFEGRPIALGTGTIVLEVAEQMDAPDAVLVAVGGGGLLGGVANAARRLWPHCEIIGVEPEGADTMSRSLAAGQPVGIETVRTIADSLGAPYAKPYSFALCRDNLDRMVRVSDEQLRAAMAVLFRRMAIAVEPACAATTAALLGPLKNSMAGRRVLLLFCGSNIDWASFQAEAQV
jgi:threonine dehydratase